MCVHGVHESSPADLAETFEVLYVAIALHLILLGFGRSCHGERLKLHQQQLLRKVFIDL